MTKDWNEHDELALLEDLIKTDRKKALERISFLLNQ